MADAKAALDAERLAVADWKDAREDLRSAQASSDQADLDAAVAKYRDAARVLAAKKRDTDAKIRTLVSASDSAYSVKPAVTASQTSGLVDWNPVIDRCEIIDEETHHCRLRTDSELKEDERRRQSQANGRHLAPPGPVYAWTDPASGQVRIGPAALDRQDLVEFPATLVHEGVHWVDVQSVGPVRREDVTPTMKFRRERDALREEASFFRRLGQGAKAAEADAVANQYDFQLQVSERRKLSWLDIRTDPSYRTWQGVQDTFQSGGATAGDPSELNFDAETLAAIREAASAVDARVASEAAARRRAAGEAIARSDMRRRGGDWVLSEAAQCGLRPLDSGALRFFVAGKPQVEVVSMDAGDDDAFRASLLLVAACHSPDNEVPCNDSIDVLKTRRDEADFREKLELYSESEEGIAFCVAHLARDKDLVMSYRAIRKEAKSYRDRLVKRPRKPSAGGGVPERSGAGGRSPREREGGSKPDVPWCLQKDGRRCIR